MIRLRLFRPDRTPQEFVFEGNVATIGRGSECDVVIDSPFVSKRHALILCGVVLVDLGSSNGTSIDGHRIQAAAPYSGGVVCLGNENIRLEIDVDELRSVAESAREESDLESAIEATPARAPLAPEPVPGGRASETASPHAGSQTSAAVPAAREHGGELALVRAELERTRERVVELDGENERLRFAAQEHERSAEVRARAFDEEQTDLHRRLDTLREEVENREVEASAELQVRLARARQAEIAADNDKLRARITELEASALHIAGGRTDPASAARLERLEVALRASEVNARELAAELEKVSAGQSAAALALPVSDLFQRLQSDNAKLRAQLAESRGVQHSTSTLPGELFSDLRAENDGLRKRVSELEAAARALIAGDPSQTLEARAALEREIDGLREANGRLLRKVEAASHTARTSSAGNRVQAALDGLDAEEDGELGAEAFLLLSSLRFLRRIERIVTRLAAGFAQIHASNTLLPESGQSFRTLAAALLRPAAGARERSQLELHFEQLGSWLTVSVAAPRQAAERFAFALKEDLSERSLVENDPIPMVRRLAGQAETELWRRVCTYLADLSADRMEDRIAALTRAAAHELYESARRKG